MCHLTGVSSCSTYHSPSSGVCWQFQMNEQTNPKMHIVYPMCSKYSFGTAIAQNEMLSNTSKNPACHENYYGECCVSLAGLI